MTLSDLHQWLPTLLTALGGSVKLWAVVLAGGLPAGVLLSLGLLSRSKLVKAATLVVVELGRGTPTLVLLYLGYFGLPRYHIILSGFTAAALALGLTTATYTSEIFRAGFLTIPAGQEEAAKSLGLGYWRTQFSVIIPQVLRIVIVPILGYSILTLQGTSLAFTVAYNELLGASYNLVTVTSKPMPVLLLAAGLYAIIAITISQGVRYVEYRSRKTMG